MGIFGNLSDSFNNLTYAIESLVFQPWTYDSFFKNIANGGAIFMKQSLAALTSPMRSFLQTFKNGAQYLFQSASFGALD